MPSIEINREVTVDTEVEVEVQIDCVEYNGENIPFSLEKDSYNDLQIELTCDDGFLFNIIGEEAVREWLESKDAL